MEHFCHSLSFVLFLLSLLLIFTFCVSYSSQLTILTSNNISSTSLSLSFPLPSIINSSKISGSSSSSSGATVNDEEAEMVIDGSSVSMAPPHHFVDRQPWSTMMFDPSHPPISSSLSSNGEKNLGASLNGNKKHPFDNLNISSRNCSYNPKNQNNNDNDVFCDCDLLNRRYSCYNIQSVEHIRGAYEHLLNTTRLVYWSSLEVHCIEPIPLTKTTMINDEGEEKGQSIVPQSFHITHEMFSSEGPRFESILFVGDCSKPKHYDNLITVDREVQKIIMIKNMLRMATSCSLLQPKFERLTELILNDCVVAGDMISSTFSTRCLGLISFFLIYQQNKL